jgi:tetratricopeptide (TPR) repeat protein
MICAQCGEENPADHPDCPTCRAMVEARRGRATAPTVSGSAPTEVPSLPETLPPDATSTVFGSRSGATLSSADTRPRSAPTGHDGPPGVTAVRPTGVLQESGLVFELDTGMSGSLTVGGTFAGRYEIVALRGRGGMGSVYAARDRELDKVIALKTIRGADEGDTLAVQRFKQELLLARRITHKNVVRIYDLGEADGIKFFTMELISGADLKQMIRREGRIPFARTVTLARGILAGLQEAHEQGVVHRDLKPQNVMVDEAGVPHLMDFGIARAAGSEGLTATGAIIGTPDYMSPEQVRGETVDQRADIFSFGVILYEMLTGHLPYHGDTPVSKIMMRLTHKPRAPRELSVDIPGYLEAVVLKCMEIDPALRYQSAAEILHDLDREHVSRSLTLRVQRAAAGRTGAVAAALALAVLATAGGVYLSRRGAAAPAAGAPAPEGPVHTLAIVPFTNATGSPELEWMRTGLPEMLVTDLSQSRYVRPVPGERVHRVLQEAGLAQQSRFDEKALEAVSTAAHAQSVLSGQFVEASGRLRLDLSLRKAGSGVAVPIKVEAAPSEVFALVDQITRGVKEQLDLTPAQLRGDTDRPVADVSTPSLEAQHAYLEGLARLRQGENQAAVPLLKDATAKDPKFAMAYAMLAEANVNAGQHDDAVAAVDRARALAENAALPLAQRYQIHATAALVKEDHETAARSYRELSRLYPEDPDVSLSLARALEKTGDYPEALAAYQRVVQLAPGYGAALLGMGRAQVVSGHPDEAIRSLQEALATKQFDGQPEALGMIHSILGLAYRNTSRLDQAVTALNLSYDYRVKAGDKRGQAVTLTNLAGVYESRGEIDRALAAENKALALTRELKDRKQEAQVLTNIGLTYNVAGKLDKALAAFREALQIATERQDHRALASGLNKIGEIYRRMGRYDDAMVYLEQAKVHLQQSQEKEIQAVNLNYIGQVRKAQGLYDQALEAYLASLPLFTEIKQEMGVAMTHHDLGEIYAAQGRYADARGALEQSVEIYQRLNVVHDIAESRAPLGHLLASLGRVEEADKELREAERAARETKAEGILPEILLGQAEVAHLRGRPAEAAALFEQANVKANLSGQKELAVESRVELGRLYLEQGKPANAERLLRRTRNEARQARLRPLEAAATAALAQALLAGGDAEGARKESLAAIGTAERFAGRPVLLEANGTLGRALEKLGRAEEALDAYAKAAAALEWIRGSLRPEDVGPYMGRHDVQEFLAGALPKLEKAGRGEIAALRKWLRRADPA